MTTVNLAIFGIGNVGSTLINQIQKIKQNLLDKGKNKLTDLLGVKKDSTKKANTTDKIKGVLGNFFGKKKSDN